MKKTLKRTLATLGVGLLLAPTLSICADSNNNDHGGNEQQNAQATADTNQQQNLNQDQINTAKQIEDYATNTLKLTNGSAQALASLCFFYSGLNPDAVTKDGGQKGLLLWSQDRFGLTGTDLNSELQLINKELNSPQFQQTLTSLRQNDNVYTGLQILLQQYIYAQLNNVQLTTLGLDTLQIISEVNVPQNIMNNQNQQTNQAQK